MKDFFLLLIPLAIIIGFVVFILNLSDARNVDGSVDLENSHIYSVIVIDSCEYIRGPYSICHKGNCKFCLVRYSNYIDL